MRILKLYALLISYFQSESQSEARFTRLHAIFSDPMTEIHLLFYEHVLLAFNNLNLLLQREDTTFYLIADQIRAFLKKLMAKFIKIQVIEAAS